MSKKSGRKNSAVARAAHRLIVICLVGIILVSGYKIFTIINEYYKARDSYSKVTDIAKVDKSKFTGEIDWDALLGVNKDVQGWIYLKDSTINYPIVKGRDNEEYLHRLIDGTYNFAGTIFIDYRCEDNFGGFNTIIYGHHMKDGSMFADLSDYIREEGFYESHRQMEIITPHKKYHMLVFSAFITSAGGDKYQYEFADRQARQNYIQTLKSASVLSADDIEVGADDKLVLLSTCVAAEGEERYIIAGKLVPWTED